MSIIITESASGDNLHQLFMKYYSCSQRHVLIDDLRSNHEFKPTIEEVMKSAGLSECPEYITSIRRRVRLPDMKLFWIWIPIYRVNNKLTRFLPGFLTQYKQYPVFVIEDVLNKEMFPENEANVVMKETPLNPVWETRDNWKRWFKLNLSLFLSILSELFGPGEPDLLGYLQGTKPTGWLVFLVKTAYVHKETLKCAPWRRWPCEKAA